jgi:type I restriction enzyme S subunit
MKSKNTTMFEAIGDQGLMTDGDWIESKDQDLNGDVRLIQLADIGDGVFLNKSRKYVNSETVERLRCTLIKKGDVLIARMPDPLGRACVFPDLKQPAITAVDICIVRTCRNDINPDWLAYYLNSPDIRLQIQSHAQGATRARVPTGKLKKLDVQIPSTTDQRRIAARLKAQLTEVEKARKAAEAQLHDMQLLEMKTIETIFSELDTVLKAKIGDLAQTTSGSTPSRSQINYWKPAEIPWVKTAEVAFAPITSTEESISRKALQECSLTLLPTKTVLVAMYGQGKTRGQSAILEMAATTNQACFAILPNETWEPEFLYYWLKRSYLDLRVLSEDRGGNQANLNGALLKAFEVPTPEKSVQRKIVEKVGLSLEEINLVYESCNRTLADIQQIPNRLLSKAFEMN